MKIGDPLEAVPVNGDPPFPVRVAPNYSKNGGTPIEFPVSPWNGRNGNIVAYVNEHGLLIGAVSNVDYQGGFFVRPVGSSDTPIEIEEERERRREARFRALRCLPDPVL